MKYETMQHPDYILTSTISQPNIDLINNFKYCDQRNLRNKLHIDFQMK